MKNSLDHEGLRFIARWEGLSLRAYQDIVGVWTIGYGHTATAKPGMVITKDEADKLLRFDALTPEHYINRVVQVPLSQNQYNALVSFAFNVGTGAFGKSTLLKVLNKGDYEAAANEFLRWNKAAGKAVKGLTNRRFAEQQLFRFKGDIN